MSFHHSPIMSQTLNNLLICFIPTGIFTVPVSGVYLFTYMVNTFVNAYQLVVKLVVDGENYSDGISDPFHSGQVKNEWNISMLTISSTFRDSRNLVPKNVQFTVVAKKRQN